MMSIVILFPKGHHIRRLTDRHSRAIVNHSNKPFSQFEQNVVSQCIERICHQLQKGLAHRKARTKEPSQGPRFIN